MLAGYLQNGEVLVMKHAMVKWHKEADKLGLQYRLANFVHDEWQSICYGSKEDAERLARLQREAIEWAGRELGVRCPLAGASTIGKTWLDTH
jgi:DNA polymerase I-like protein with 3'-5' exonuclease and polymerase domains